MSGDSIATDGGLIAAFLRHDDRTGHRIDFRDRGLLQSVESDSSEPWPLSPPLQQLSIEDLGAGPVGLLVGMAGKSHWSVSVEAREEMLVFDVACRVRGEPERLGSTYRVDGEIGVEPDDDGVTLHCPEGMLRLLLDHDEALAAARIHFDPQARRLALLVDPQAVDSQPGAATTLRWRYRLTHGS